MRFHRIVVSRVNAIRFAPSRGNADFAQQQTRSGMAEKSGGNHAFIGITRHGKKWMGQMSYQGKKRMTVSMELPSEAAKLRDK